MLFRSPTINQVQDSPMSYDKKVAMTTEIHEVRSPKDIFVAALSTWYREQGIIGFTGSQSFLTTADHLWKNYILQDQEERAYYQALSKEDLKAYQHQVAEIRKGRTVNVKVMEEWKLLILRKTRPMEFMVAAGLEGKGRLRFDPDGKFCRRCLKKVTAGRQLRQFLCQPCMIGSD